MYFVENQYFNILLENYLKIDAQIKFNMTERSITYKNGGVSVSPRRLGSVCDADVTYC